ncbi:MAG: SDR family oxidoreductase [Anaerolineae bacterium]|nr:SDR family oxidoreductase [Anaerolineae bacterium]
MSTLLKEKVAIVTGGAQGLGARFAVGLAKQGAKVIVADILDGTEVAEEIRELGGESYSQITDVTDDSSCVALVAFVEEKFGGLDVLVNNAALFGKVPSAPLTNIPLKQWDDVMRVNVRGVWQCTKAALPALEKSGGSIINITSNRVFKGYPNLLHYDASKGAILAMTRAMAAELGDKKIRVNAVAPGLTMSENVIERDGVHQVNEIVVSNRAFKRSQVPEDVVGAVVFLASDMSANMTGQTMVVDGGSVMH